ncbi:ATP phosphoribosyltransferase regulatory subunit [Photobacterium phosphoreum]|nr:hypothetical protein AYY25_12300 [Photobacterium phosphoreum]
MQALLNNAPKLLDYLSEDSQRHFSSLCKLLTLSGIEYTINPRLVRGLDYYNKTVFEWITSELGSQSTVCGGGRYDGLFELFGSKSTPASGFAIGLERLLLLLETSQNLPTSSIDIIITNESNDDNDELVATYFKIRDIAANFVILNDFSFSSIKKQHNRAINKNPKLIITIKNNSEINIWDLRDNSHYNNETISSIPNLLSSLL